MLERISDIRKSVVAIHGLNGHYLNTWTWQDPKVGTNWLTDLLPAKLANARIMSFAYNANTFVDQSKGELMDHAVALLDYLDMKREGIQAGPEKSLIQKLVLTICRDLVLSSLSLIALGVLL